MCLPIFAPIGAAVGASAASAAAVGTGIAAITVGGAVYAGTELGKAAVPTPPQIPAAPVIQPPPQLAPPVPSETSTPGITTVQARQRQVQMLKYGSLSTITNAGGAAGISGGGADLYPTMGVQGKQFTGQ